MSSPGKVTVIDAARGVMPRAFDRPGAGPDAQQRVQLAALAEKAAEMSAQEIVELALTGNLAGRTAVVSSFGAESAVLLHLVAQINPDTPILFLNTGKLFGETLRYRDRLQDALGLGDVRSLSPSLDARQAAERDFGGGPRLDPEFTSSDSGDLYGGSYGGRYGSTYSDPGTTRWQGQGGGHEGVPGRDLAEEDAVEPRVARQSGPGDDVVQRRPRGEGEHSDAHGPLLT